MAVNPSLGVVAITAYQLCYADLFYEKFLLQTFD